ncbi:sensor domain-containing diguanylate cyclase [Caproiciproducens sp. R2]|uniref:sensor domain-containing diguanylate cyclase n=1 Tax=Caproiciproducens sp. R2 TaxID=3435187 RepID=UPI004034212C
MKRFIKFADGLLIVSFCLILLSVFSGTGRHENAVSNGVLDIGSAGLSSPVPMTGAWEFYWGRQVSPQGKITDADNKQLVQVPANWTAYRDADNKACSQEGYTVYRVVLKAQKGLCLGLKIPQIGSSYRLWIDGNIRFESGRVGKNASESRPEWTTQSVFFQTQREDTEILIEVSNFDYFRSGLTIPVVVGTQQQIQRLGDQGLFMDTFLFSSLFVMAVFFFLLYFVRSHDKAHICLALFAAAISLRPLLYGECYFNKIFPGINFEFNTKLYLVNFVVIQLLCLFFYYQYKELSSRRFMRVSGAAVSAIVFVGVFLPARYMLYPVVLLEAMIPVTVANCLVTLMRAMRKKYENAGINLLSVLLLFFLSIVDILKNNGLIEMNLYYTPIAMLVVTFIQIFLQVGRFRESDLLNEKLANEVGIKNLKLEYEMKQRSITEKLNNGLRAMVSALEIEGLLVSILENLYQIIEFESAVMVLRVNESLGYIVTKLNHEKVVCRRYSGRIVLRDQNQSENRNGGEKVRVHDLYTRGKDGKSLIVKSLYYNHKLFCVIKMIVSKSREISAGDLELVDIYTEQSILAFQNAKSYEKIKELALYDELSGIYNRRQLMKLGIMEYISAREAGCDFYAMMLDIDFFKAVNDTYGHLFGDKIIKNVANICKRCIPVSAVVGRYGGEEFLIFLKDMEKEDVGLLAEKLNREVRSCSYSCEGNDHIHVTVSIGVARGKREQVNLYDLINHADKAMYLAKKEGRDCVRWFEQE